MFIPPFFAAARKAGVRGRALNTPRLASGIAWPVAKNFIPRLKKISPRVTEYFRLQDDDSADSRSDGIHDWYYPYFGFQ